MKPTRLLMTFCALAGSSLATKAVAQPISGGVGSPFAPINYCQFDGQQLFDDCVPIPIDGPPDCAVNFPGCFVVTVDEEGPGISISGEAAIGATWNSAQIVSMTDLGALTLQFNALTFAIATPGLLAISGGVFDPHGMMVEIAGGSMTYDLPGGLGVGSPDFAANPL